MPEPPNPKRLTELEATLGPDFRAMADRVEAEGWTRIEIAGALLSLALSYGREFMTLNIDLENVDSARKPN